MPALLQYSNPFAMPSSIVQPISEPPLTIKQNVNFEFNRENFSMIINEKVNTFYYSIFIPADIDRILTVLNKSYPVDYECSSSTNNLTESHSGYGGTHVPSISNHVSSEVMEHVINKISPLLVSYNFEYWNTQTKHIDKILEIRKKHSDIFSYESSTAWSQIKTRYKNIDSRLYGGHIVPGYEGHNCILFLFINLMFDEKEKDFFLNDLLKFSTIKVLTILEKLCLAILGIDQHYTNILYDVAKYDGKLHPIKKLKLFQHKLSKDHYYKMALMSDTSLEQVPNIIFSGEYGMFSIYLDILKYHIPKRIDEFPLKESCKNIPKLLNYPKTEFQWALTNAAIKKNLSHKPTLNHAVIIEDNQHCRVINNTRKKQIKENTKYLMPYINASDKALKLYDEYILRRNVVAPVPGWNTDAIFQPVSKYKPETLLQFIEDGKEIYNRYPKEIVTSDGNIIKLAPIKGSFLKQLKNAIYNHNTEKTIGIEEKLKIFLKEGDESMFIEIELPEILEKHRIKTKAEIITLGKILGHCIGSKADSKNLFFRKDTVCAEVNPKIGNIIQCYDAHDKKNEKTKEFEKFLSEEFKKIKPTEKNEDGPNPIAQGEAAGITLSNQSEFVGDGYTDNISGSIKTDNIINVLTNELRINVLDNHRKYDEFSIFYCCMPNVTSNNMADNTTVNSSF